MQYERRWLAVSAIGLSLFLSALDATIVALALPPIAHHFRLSDSLASAVTLSYAIPLTLLILPSGDLIGRFRVLPTFLVAVLGFGLGSIICGLASSFPLLLVGRVVQGCFGAVIATQGIAVAAAVVSPGERGRAMGIVFLMTTKPALTGSLIVMAVALVLGLASGLLASRATRTRGQGVAAAGALQPARRAPGRATIRRRLSPDGRFAASTVVPVGTPRVFLECIGRRCALLPLTV